MSCVADEAVRRTRDTVRKRKREERRKNNDREHGRSDAESVPFVPSPVMFLILSEREEEKVIVAN